LKPISPAIIFGSEVTLQKMAKSKLVKKFMLFGYVAVFLGLIITMWGLLASIKLEANNLGENAVNVFHKDKVESLLLLLDSDRYSIKDKNNAIWALGVLKDKRALSKLESLVTDEKSNQAEKLCQSEIKKSILKIKGTFIISRQAQCN
jgi:hypothetical protein